jgi:hypothetical protein
MMRNDPMPSLGLGIILPAGASYDRSHHWRTSGGELRASVRFEVGGYSDAHLQGHPTALRELAAALIDAADRADTWHTLITAPAAEGVAG